MALPHTLSNDSLHIKSKRSISNTDISNHDNNVKKQRTKKTKKPRMMMMTSADSNEETSEEESLLEYYNNLIEKAKELQKNSVDDE